MCLGKRKMGMKKIKVWKEKKNEEMAMIVEMTITIMMMGRKNRRRVIRSEMIRIMIRE